MCALLCLLVENHDRLVSKSELLEKVWDGRVVSDAAISTVIKSTRKVLGDDGTRQHFIRTVRGRGYRFESPVRIIGVESMPRTSSETTQSPAMRNPSLAILPFSLIGDAAEISAIADAIPAELISSLSRLRWVQVIARGSSFRFRDRDVSLDAIADMLGAGYCLTGMVEIFGKALTIAVEISDTKTGLVIWSERFPTVLDEIHDARANIVASVVNAMELHVPANEANSARLAVSEDLDAWSTYHIGLQNMYRFNDSDNKIAANSFDRAIQLDPQFARAYAARSFVAFQSAFMKYAGDVNQHRADARRFGERAVELDPIDPFCSYNLGRSYWLDGDPDRGLDFLGRSTEINPNYAQGFYALGWTDVMAGRGASGITNVERALTLSPLDPLRYAMQATKGMAYLLNGDGDSAADWVDRAARTPGAHFLIGAIAAAVLHSHGDVKRAQYWAESVRMRRSDASVEHFVTAFPFVDADFRSKMSEALKACGF